MSPIRFFRPRSLRQVFILVMAVIILLLSTPLLLSGHYLLQGILLRQGAEILNGRLNSLLAPVYQRYDNLLRVGMEDSAEHLTDIRDSAMETLKEYSFQQSGSFFVISSDGDIILSRQFASNADSTFAGFFNALKHPPPGLIAYDSPAGRQLAVSRFSPQWDGYVGISISRAELLAPARNFLIINLLVFLVVTAIAIYVIHGLQQRLIVPLLELTSYAGRVAGGDLPGEPEGRFSLELAVLRRDILAMVHTLRQKIVESTEQLATISKGQAALAQTTSELRESEERYRTIYNAPGEAIFLHDAASGRIIDVNHAMLQMYGVSYEEALNWRPEDGSSNAPPYTCEEALDRIRAAIEQGPQMLEWHCRRKDGSLFWGEVALRHVRLGEQNCVMAVVRNVDERKRAEEALATERERLAVTLLSIGDGVITTDTTGRVVLLNRVAEQLTGWSLDEARGRPLDEILCLYDAQEEQLRETPCAAVLRTGQRTELAAGTLLLARDGRRCHVADSAAPIRDPRGRLIGVVLVFRDVSDSLRVEQELHRMKKLEAIGVLAAGIAHDFNNLLAAILGNLDMARLSLTATDGETGALMAEAIKACLRAKDLSRQLLTFAKGGAPIRETSAIAGVVRDSTAFILRGSQIHCTWDIPEDLWLVDIDGGQISQVIQNIILNAREAIPGNGSILVRCRNVAASKPPARDLGRDAVAICISDSGPGIPIELQEKIFDPYFSTKPQGSGLGLAICHSIVRKHDGLLTVQSSPGEGASFTILLPTSATHQAASKANPVVKTTARTGGTILLVDDEEMIRDVASAMLRHLGYEVLAVPDGRKALAAYALAMSNGAPYTLVIMDLTIPGGMGGQETMAELLQLDPAARGLVSSGYAHDPVMAAYRDYGFAGVVTKPYLLRELAEALDRVLG